MIHANEIIKTLIPSLITALAVFLLVPVFRPPFCISLRMAHDERLGHASIKRAPLKTLV
jgi:hypothetical protein